MDKKTNLRLMEKTALTTVVVDNYYYDAEGDPMDVPVIVFRNGWMHPIFPPEYANKKPDSRVNGPDGGLEGYVRQRLRSHRTYLNGKIEDMEWELEEKKSTVARITRIIDEKKKEIEGEKNG